MSLPTHPVHALPPKLTVTDAPEQACARIRDPNNKGIALVENGCLAARLAACYNACDGIPDPEEFLLKTVPELITLLRASRSPATKLALCTYPPVGCDCYVCRLDAVLTKLDSKDIP